VKFQELTQRALTIREQIRVYEHKQYGSSWSNEELALGFVGDVGDLVKLVMAANGRRKIPDTRDKLEHELADCLWSVIVLAEVHGVNLEEAFLKTMDDLELWIQAGRTTG
jgi:NTP pyrophosphatase (non-canonical NTP hydrolase)